MVFTLDSVVPWGRPFDEYVSIFSLTPNDLEKRIIGCGDGPASFNAAMRKRGKFVVSVDPIYEFSGAEIRRRVEEVYPKMMEQILAHLSTYIFTTITSPEHLGRIRMGAMEEFLEDFECGKAEGRYLPHALPHLPYADDSFDLALCSHVLLTYSEQLSCRFHCEATLEMCRVAREVRIHPLLAMSSERSVHLPVVCGEVREHGYRCEIEPVDFEFQRGANEMLRIWR
jgi:hypothetical protein